jgi:hypothetical protein
MTASGTPPRPRNWGPWQLDAEVRVLRSKHYEVDLDRCTTSAEVLDHICQVVDKTWADDAIVAGLVRALNDVLKPQANLCSFGGSTELSPERIGTLVRAVDRR